MNETAFSHRRSTGDAGLPLGAIIPGSQYRVISKLGSGGMGSVYEAEHVALEKRVALKVLRSDTAHSQDAIDRLRDEARAASRIGSEFICDVTDFGQMRDGRVFLVMEYLDGVSLGRVVKQGPMPPDRALPILRQIAKALEAAHEKGIVHLDVKPDNVMLLRRGRRDDAVKVVDFGVARLLGSLRREEKVTGTPEYVAPERFVGATYDHRADIYAFGVLAYETLTGTVPFKGANALATFTMHVEDLPPAMPSALGLPSQLQSAIRQMLQKDPALRPASMAIAEAMLCESQIAAGVRTAWDDLELPAVDEQWRRRLASRMPSPWGRQKKAIVAGALSIAVAGASLGFYYGFVRAPDVVVKYVALTQTEEADAVAGWLQKADAAARAAHYTRPAQNSALDLIKRAEAEHAKIRGDKSRSKGAEDLRRRYAMALSVAGDELAKNSLGHLAKLRYSEALLFTPDDTALAAKSELSPEDQSQVRERARIPARGKAPPRPAPAPSPADEAKEVAASAYLLAAGARFSEARVALRTLAALDRDGLERAKLADALRRKADVLWAQGKTSAARPFYQLTGELDELDVEAKQRGRAPVAAATPAPPPPVVEAAAVPRKVAAAPEELKAAPRDPKASRVAVDRARFALGRLSLQEAESGFNQALEADSTNANAIAGLAEVAFERSRYTEALDYARRAVQQAPRSSRYLILVGDAYFKLFRYADAKAAYERALELGAPNESVRHRLTRVKTKLGQ